MIVYENKYVYVHIPKCGGETIKQWIRDHYRVATLGNIRNHEPMFEVESLLPQTQYTYWTTVRNPYARMLSQYNQNYRNRWFVEEHNDPSFLDWCEYCYSHKDKGPWVVAHTFGGSVIDYVSSDTIQIRLEDFATIHEYDFTPDTPLDVHINSGYNSVGGDYRPHYCDRTYEIITEVFAKDIAKHGYTF